MKLLKKIQYNSPVVLTFVFISFVVLLLGELTKGVSTRLAFCVYKSSPLNFMFYIRLFGHVLGHAGWEHFVSNMMYLLLMGPMLEEKYGSKLLLGMIVLTALVTGLINIAFFNTALLGASGIVFMMIILSSFTGATEGRLPLTLIIVGLLFIGQEIISGLTVKDNISHLTHIVGGVCGGSFGIFLNRKEQKI